MASPLKQFEIQPLIQKPLQIFGYDIYFTNSALFMVLAVITASVFLLLAVRKESILPGPLQSAGELIYKFAWGIFEENVGAAGKAYFPFVFSIFLFILFGNLLGLIPYGFTVTSHLIVTFALALMIFIFMTAIGIRTHGIRFLKIFYPSGVPIFLAPIIIPIEILSYFSKPISLSLRLFANMMAGHMILKVFASFTVQAFLSLTVLSGLLGCLIVLFNAAFIGFELFIAMLQAYIFMLLSCIYLHDAVHLH